ncbi:lysine biosynthesis protein LysX [Sulfurisphaera tokodaii]|uniref:Glutamate--LysW ligase ArgX n=2 Tax=Sulfurisphaera tokodaii TaxID=111955 RepID=ARGX_SULTO|nr:lysine biosynthesis protein LysX [Sulfurisphaera tokodaii]Q970U6.1 RecName: Full=Glutamate--LysW ligase ArgX [Sulfurisphaera tokodaii str. 7]3VPB_A Chain A, Putative acetylornithine deacetylase [Sulfurisphaera tokodaii str. 7]3VPB_B Chain B, Putative acetylornithine deacetylase [Sulfurisphaera tokodaii str. 7]3VPB_C Chain C, Putative acetylornithine deacetylase [Sulfurisphaera tokodaii str. 7]3VPB_D Chain D, Putative acetylornithine deacetylase [Sulfurisphaera tokodaii str. 7]3VPC_A Chain 
MRVVLIVDIVRQEEKLIAKALEENKVQYDIINVAQEPLPFNKALGRYDVAIIRPVSMYRALYSSAVLEAAGVHTINSSDVINVCGDKILTYSKLYREGIPIPDSIIALSAEAALKAYEQRGFPLIDKPPIGSWGRLVSLIRDVFEGKTIIEHRELMGNSALKAHIVQEYIQYKGRDIRCIAIGEELLGCYARNIPPNEWRANVALGGTPSNIEVDEKLKETVVKAVSIVHGEFVSIDILEHPNKGYVVNELNDVPEFKGFMVATNINVAQKLVEYIKENYSK